MFLHYSPRLGGIERFVWFQEVALTLPILQGWVDCLAAEVPQYDVCQKNQAFSEIVTHESWFVCGFPFWNENVTHFDLVESHLNTHCFRPVN